MPYFVLQMLLQSPSSRLFCQMLYMYCCFPVVTFCVYLEHRLPAGTSGNDNPACETAKETQMYRTVFWTLWERAWVGWFGRMALKHAYYHKWNELPIQVRRMIQDARGWCPGMTQRDGTEREVGEGFRMGNTCIPVADSCWYMAKPIQYCKVINFQLK